MRACARTHTHTCVYSLKQYWKCTCNIILWWIWIFPCVSYYHQQNLSLPHFFWSSVIFLSRKVWRVIIINLLESLFEVLVIFVGFLLKLNFHEVFFRDPRYKISWKSLQWDFGCSMQTDRWASDKANHCFCNFVKVPKNQQDASS
jgi:hypothetical protein